MAMCHEIMVGKTGCLTKSRMNVGKYQIGLQTDTTDHIREDLYANSFSTRLEIQQEIKNIIEESIISNTEVRIEENDHELCYEPKGQEIEVALIKFLVDNEKDIHQDFMTRNKNTPKLVCLPFD